MILLYNYFYLWTHKAAMKDNENPDTAESVCFCVQVTDKMGWSF